MLLLQLAFTYSPAVNRTLSSAPLDMEQWVRILLVAAGGYLIVELEKAVRRVVAASQPDLSDRARGTVQ
jgi:hypothetical protein